MNQYGAMLLLYIAIIASFTFYYLPNLQKKLQNSCKKITKKKEKSRAQCFSASPTDLVNL